MVTNSNDNYFHILMENHVSKIIFNIFALLVIIIFAPLYYFVVWYERYGGNDSKRTLISQLLALMCKIVIAYLLVGLTGEVLISTFGPLPSWYCQIQTFYKYAIFTSLVVTFNFIIFVKYLFVFWLKNPGSVCDDFWSSFLTIWIIGFTVVSQFVQVY
jgi:hypothetical protein